MSFTFNQHGVCENPEIVFHHIKPNDLAWKYISIEVAEYEGKWIYGLWAFGAAIPCSATRLGFKTKESAIEYAIKQIKNLIMGESLQKTPETVAAFEKWVSTRKVKQNQLF